MLKRLQNILTASSVLRRLPPNLPLRAESMSAVPEGSRNAFPEPPAKHPLATPDPQSHVCSIESFASRSWLLGWTWFEPSLPTGTVAAGSSGDRCPSWNKSQSPSSRSGAFANT